ncbi:MAG TPA: quinone-dependent dihydroorotate dehydrogenase [Patescibacteria group bacterium]|nr:quinone-dependent dihydroorotate dehydrogenase [Patescibacteria group bacterium]
MQKIFLRIYAFFYRVFLKRIFFLLDPEFIHESIMTYGEKLGNFSFSRFLIRKIFFTQNKSLNQEIAGIKFSNPIGLAAGFDYQGQLTQILPNLSFGFQTIGTITNQSYEGNLKPRLGRLSKSKSLMVNKGFKNPGIKAIIKKLQKSQFETPVGLSIGQTNSAKEMAQGKAIEDIVDTFKIAESAKAPFSYYELNISCPNLFSKVSFYPPKNLKVLLEAVTALKLKIPLFIKMPIEQTDGETMKMLDVIVDFPTAGVIFGNLQKNRKDKTLNPDEVKRFPAGNFSGKPTEQRSNELIALAYKKYGKRLVIIGCGGIFSAKDAYQKIKLGATLVQLITGLIFEGPQLVAQINLELPRLLKKDGFNQIYEAVGTGAKLRS